MAMNASMRSTTPPTTFLDEELCDASIDFIHCRIKKCWLQQWNNVEVRKGKEE